MSSLAEELRALGADLHPALDAIAVPAWVIDTDLRFVYLNRAALARFGDLRGQKFGALLAPDSIRLAREAFARKLVGGETTSEYEVTVVDARGRSLPGEISSVALGSDGHVVGVFGLIELGEHVRTPAIAAPALTPRQAEVLRHLADGLSTTQIATMMGLDISTVRGHIRDVLGRLGVHSRLEAVVRAHRLQLVA